MTTMALAVLLLVMLVSMALAPDHQLILDSNIFGEALWEPWAYGGIVALLAWFGYGIVRDAYDRIGAEAST
ncbi:MAG: hypothetical protein WC683_11785 [bacterium]